MRDRQLKKQNKKAEKIIFERNQSFYDAIVAEHYPKKETIARPLFLSLGSIALVVILVVSLILIFPKTQGYLDDNEQSKDISMEELNVDLEEFSVNVEDSFDTIYKKKYDSISNDILYYQAIITSEITSARIYLYVNDKYEKRYTITEVYVEKVVNGFTVKYNEKVVNDDELYEYTVKAQLLYNNIEIYIEYEELSLSPTSNFLDFVADTLIQK